MSRSRRSDTPAALFIRVVCAILFIFFSFVYLYGFQGDMMQLTQHLVSGGRTTYRVLLFPWLITGTLSVLGYLTGRFARYPLRYRAMAWLPSFVVLGCLTGFNLSPLDDTPTTGLVTYLVLLLVFLLATFLLRQSIEPRHDKSAIQELLWPNILLMVVGMVLTCIIGNTNLVLHYELRTGRLASEGEYERVVVSELNNEHPSRRMMSLRMYALGNQGKLGDELFRFPGNLGGEDVLPSLRDTLLHHNLPALVKEHLGRFPLHDMNGTSFLLYATGDTLVSAPLREYLLSSLLLDGLLSQFADSLVAYYGPKEESKADVRPKQKVRQQAKETVRLTALPRHYGEALVLYARQEEHPKAVLEDSLMQREYEDFLATLQDEEVADDVARFKGTYWYYYHHKVIQKEW